MKLNTDFEGDSEQDIFDGLDARQSQRALAEKLNDEEKMIENIERDETADAEQMNDQDPSDDLAVSEADCLEDTEANESVVAMADADVAAMDNDQGVEEEPVDVVWNAAQEAEHLRLVEALLFAATQPLDEKTLEDRLPQGVNLLKLLETLSQHYENRGVNLAKIAGKWRFVTSAETAHILEKEKVEPKKLSRAALETLAIIAYHQPCTRADIEDVRGVQVSRGSLDQLLEIGWVRLRGRRKDSPGRPVLYGTSMNFLEHFGLETVEDLPGMADLKAAGLLDARLPPGFSIPSPTDKDEDEITEHEDEGEFAQDFMAEEDISAEVH